MTKPGSDFAKCAAVILAIILAFVSAIAWAVTANNEVDNNRKQIGDHETRIRQVEQVMPRIDEKLATIERIVREKK
jgi:predicted negative regulator of RcsB-dependent stress response